MFNGTQHAICQPGKQWPTRHSRQSRYFSVSHRELRNLAAGDLSYDLLSFNGVPREPQAHVGRRVLHFICLTGWQPERDFEGSRYRRRAASAAFPSPGSSDYGRFRAKSSEFATRLDIRLRSILHLSVLPVAESNFHTVGDDRHASAASCGPGLLLRDRSARIRFDAGLLLVSAFKLAAGGNP